MKISRRAWIQTGLGGGLGSLVTAQSSPIAESESAQTGSQRPRGIIFMVADGMSQGVLPMAEAFSQQVRGRETNWWRLLSTRGVAHGLMDTPSSDSLVTDSAAASTAWSAGQRIPNGQICVDGNGKQLESIAETLASTPVKMGLVTTARVTHATPAAFATHSPNRNREDFIAPQYLNRVEILLGGGSKHFDPNQRRDQKDIYQRYAQESYEICRSRDELLKAKSQRLLGTFSPDHIPYAIDRQQSPAMQKTLPTLAEMTEVALQRFLGNGAPFLLQVEGARVDHAAHKNDIGGLLHEQLGFDDAVATVLALTANHPDILVVMTSDHGNANPGLNGIGQRYTGSNQAFARIAKLKSSHEGALAQWRKNQGGVTDLQAFLESRFAVKPSAPEAEALLATIAGQKVVEWNHQLNNPWGIMGQIIGNHTGTAWTGITHTSDPTQLTAFGPGAEEFEGMVRNDAVREKFLRLLLG